jgi:uncharacterized protein YgiM (DUF1202 family)
MDKKRLQLVVFVQLVVLVMFSAYVLADPAVTVRKTELRAEPGSQAALVAELASGQKLEISERQGGWYHVALPDGQTGWLPLLSIRKESTGDAPQKKKSSGLRSLFSSYRTGSSGVTVATGVRGLDTVDLKNSKPNMDELMRIHQYAASEAEARSYAGQAGLKRRNVAWIDAPGKAR